MRAEPGGFATTAGHPESRPQDNMLATAWKAAARVPRRTNHPGIMTPSFIYFDLGNVLFTFDRERAFGRMAAVSGSDAATVRAVVMAGGLQEALERGAIDWLEFHATFSQRTGTTSEPTALAVAASDMFALNVGMLPVLAALDRMGMPLGILSNTCDPHWRHLLSGGFAVLPGTFRHLVLSPEEGCLKPEAGIYARAAARAGVVPGSIFFCDDVAEHVAAARAAGWDAEVFTGAARLAGQLAKRGLNLGL